MHIDHIHVFGSLTWIFSVDKFKFEPLSPKIQTSF